MNPGPQLEAGPHRRVRPPRPTQGRGRVPHGSGVEGYCLRVVSPSLTPYPHPVSRDEDGLTRWNSFTDVERLGARQGDTLPYWSRQVGGGSTVGQTLSLFRSHGPSARGVSQVSTTLIGHDVGPLSGGSRHPFGCGVCV